MPAIGFGHIQELLRVGLRGRWRETTVTSYAQNVGVGLRFPRLPLPAIYKTTFPKQLNEPNNSIVFEVVFLQAEIG